MSSFNVLIGNVRCAKCQSESERRIQFKYSDTWQYDYRIGEKLRWGGNDIGQPHKKKVKVYGILEREDCPLCGLINDVNEFDIWIENDIIVGVSQLDNLGYYVVNNGDFVIVEE